MRKKAGKPVSRLAGKLYFTWMCAQEIEDDRFAGTIVRKRDWEIAHYVR